MARCAAVCLLVHITSSCCRSCSPFALLHTVTGLNCNINAAQVPGLAVVIVGERKDSQTYVRMKKKACEEVGIASYGADLPGTATQQEVLDVVAKLNADPNVHGILVQLPVGVHLPVCSCSSGHDCVQCSCRLLKPADSSSGFCVSFTKPGPQSSYSSSNSLDNPWSLSHFSKRHRHASFSSK